MYSLELEEILGRVISLPKSYFIHSIMKKSDSNIFEYIDVLFKEELFIHECRLIYTKDKAILYVGKRICEYSNPKGLVSALTSILKYLEEQN